MKILFITSFMPKKNASQAGVNVTFNLIKILKEEFKAEVDIICTLNPNEIDENEADIKNLVKNIHKTYVGKNRKIMNIIFNLRRPIIASVRYDSRVRKIIKNDLEVGYDYVFLDYTQNSQYYNEIRTRFKNTKIVLIEHDVSFLGFERKYKQTTNLIKKLFYYFEYKRLKKYELKLIDDLDVVYTLNEKDRQLLGKGKSVEILYPYINKIDVVPEKHDGINLMFWGAMNRKENDDAVMYFINDIWDKIHKENTKLYVIGNKPSKRLLNIKDNDIIVTGFVENPADYFKKIDISVVPLRLGAGIKIKVLESLASNIPVVTTDVGVEGIEVKNNQDILVANSPQEFADKVNFLIDNYSKRKNIGYNGKKVIDEKYNFENNKEILSKLFNLK